MSDPSKTFVLPPHREEITLEPDPAGRWSDKFPEMIGYRNQGGGKVPADFTWRTNPKQWQEELTDQELRADAKAHHALAEVLLPLALPETATG